MSPQHRVGSGDLQWDAACDEARAVIFFSSAWREDAQL